MCQSVFRGPGSKGGNVSTCPRPSTAGACNRVTNQNFPETVRGVGGVGGRWSHLIPYLNTSGSEREPPEIRMARRGQPGLPGRGFGELQPRESVQAQHQPPSASLVPGPHSREMRAFTVCAYLFESHTYIHQPTYFLLSRIPLLFLVEYKIFDYFPKWKSRFPSLTVW